MAAKKKASPSKSKANSDPSTGAGSAPKSKSTATRDAPRKANAAKKTAVAKTKTQPKKAAAKKAVAKKAVAESTGVKKPGVKSTAVKKKAVKKKATKAPVAKKAPASKAPTRATRKAPAKEAPAKEASAKKGPAKKVRTKSAPAKKAPANKTPAGKSGPVAKAAVQITGSAAKTGTRKSSTSAEPSFTPYNARKNEEYMNEEQKEHFRDILLAWKLELMREVDRTVNHMQEEASNYPDPADRASQEEEFSLELKTRDRERRLIRKIDSTLELIDQEDYGYCESCGVEIGVRRLEARPTATQCIDCKTLAEIKEKQIRG